jgi:2-phosphosulfolactate phosphatase
MSSFLEVLAAPAEFAALRTRDLSRATCVVFDILRATSSMLTALANGAKAIWPVEEISEALILYKGQPDVLLAGERNGLRIHSDLTGGVDFHLGNSPMEFLPELVLGRTLVTTTTNGTRALRAAVGAEHVLVGAFLNLEALEKWIAAHKPPQLLLVCSGTYDQAAYEDVLAAGALCERIWSLYKDGAVADSALMAKELYHSAANDLEDALGRTRNGRRLLAQPQLAGDVRFCAQRDTLKFIGVLGQDGAVRKLD